MKTYWLIGIVLLIDITFLLVDDYFRGVLNSSGIPVWSLYALLGVLFIVSMLTHNPELEKRFRLLLLSAYPMLVMVLLTILGGESESGLSVTSPSLWIFWGIILWLGWRDYQKEKEQDEQTLE